MHITYYILLICGMRSFFYVTLTCVTWCVTYFVIVCNNHDIMLISKFKSKNKINEKENGNKKWNENK